MVQSASDLKNCHPPSLAGRADALQYWFTPILETLDTARGSLGIRVAGPNSEAEAGAIIFCTRPQAAITPSDAKSFCVSHAQGPTVDQ